MKPCRHERLCSQEIWVLFHEEKKRETNLMGFHNLVKLTQVKELRSSGWVNSMSRGRASSNVHLETLYPRNDTCLDFVGVCVTTVTKLPARGGGGKGMRSGSQCQAENVKAFLARNGKVKLGKLWSVSLLALFCTLILWLCVFNTLDGTPRNWKIEKLKSFFLIKKRKKTRHDFYFRALTRRWLDFFLIKKGQERPLSGKAEEGEGVSVCMGERVFKKGCKRMIIMYHHEELMHFCIFLSDFNHQT